MFVALYEFVVRDGQEQQFRDNWTLLTEGLYQHAGSLGSRLHRCADGRYMAYAQWPDRERWATARSQPLPQIYQQAREAMRAALLSAATVEQLEVVVDGLHGAPVVGADQEVRP